MEQQIETKKSKISPLVLILIGLVILAGIWYWYANKIFLPTTLPPLEKTITKPTLKEDSVTTVIQELDKIRIWNLEEEFKEIDQEINSL